MKDKKEKKEKTKFNLAFDNLAIPEVHIGGTVHGQGIVEHKHPDADGETEDEVVTFADVAIPEVHITRYKELSDMIHSLRKKLHENPEPNWRGKFGGEIYTYSGSHGCVNLPPSKAGELYEYVEAGMPIVCYWRDEVTFVNK